MSERFRRERLRGLFGWPLALGAGLLGFLVVLFQTAAGAFLDKAPVPTALETVQGTLAFWFRAGLHSLPIVLAVLFLSLTLGVLLSALAIFVPSPFSTSLQRLHELGGAVPVLLLVMLWRLGDVQPSTLGFVLLVSSLSAVEIARMLADTGRRMQLGHLTSRNHRQRRTRWEQFARHSMHELRAQLATRAALVASVTFGLDAALGFIGLDLLGSPTWSNTLGLAATSKDVSPLLTCLCLGSVLLTVLGAYRLVAAGRVEASPASALSWKVAARLQSPPKDDS